MRKIRDGLDGKNVEATLMELGTRFHRLIFEHFQQFQYNSIGKHSWSVSISAAVAWEDSYPSPNLGLKVFFLHKILVSCAQVFY